MMTIASFCGWRASRPLVWFAALVAAAAGLAGCGTIQFETGKQFNPDVIEQSLKTGISTVTDVRRVLGEPFGRGRALMPFHESDRTVWTYFYERGSVDMGAGTMSDQRLYLFVFIADDRLDGYMWFASKMN